MYTGESFARELSHAQIVGSFEERGWVAMTPPFERQVQDASRQDIFDVQPVYGHGFRSGVPFMTEHAGLEQLDAFFAHCEGADPPLIDNGANLSHMAADLRTHLTFIGGKEFAAGVRGLKALWISYLDASPDTKICVPPLISNSVGRAKSDGFVIRAVLDSFSNDERAQYAPRIFDSLDLLPEDLTDVIVLLVDDVFLSGSQLRQGLKFLQSKLGDRLNAATIRTTVLATSEAKVANGLPVVWDQPAGETIPVSSYYVASELPRYPGSLGADRLPITGLHSSTDYLHDWIVVMGLLLKEQHGEDVTFPGLASLVRPYRPQELV